MATHSSILAWEIPWTEETGGLQSKKLQSQTGLSMPKEGRDLYDTVKFFWGFRASLEVQMVKNLPAMQETQVQSLGWEDPLKKEMAIHSIILAGRIPWTE